MSHFKRHISPLFALAIVTGVLSLYWPGIAPGLSWANQGADGGDFITATLTGGVPHPSGYPTYLVIAQGFQALPIGNLAWRTNLMSAVFMALAAGLVFLLVENQLKSAQSGRLSALMAALAFGLAPLVWSQALVTEVYGLHAFFVALIFLQTFSEPASPTSVFKNPARGLAFGLALGNHLTVIFFAPLLLLPGAFEKSHRWNGILKRLAWAALGSLIYLILPLRALNDAPVNWGNPATWDGFFWLVGGTVYRSYLFNFDLTDLPLRLTAWLKLFLDQFTLPGLLLGFLGAFTPRQSVGLRLTTIWGVVGLGLLSVAYGSRDSFVYLIPACLGFSVWMGLGLEQSIVFGQKKLPRAANWLGVIVIVLLLTRAVSTFPQVDASRDGRAEAFGQEFSQTLPPQAIALAEEDQETFGLWYFHYALGQRPDIVVLVRGLLPYDWYRETLRSTYPGFALPETSTLDWVEGIKQANPTRPFCTVAVYGRVVIICE